MNVKFAQTFLAVVKTGNLNQAAKLLHITESTVTTRINALEAQLGQKLLLRHRNGATLTSAGFKFQRYAEIMSNAWGQAQQELTLSEGFESVCNVGCHHDLWASAGQPWADKVREHHPEVALSFWAGNTQDIERWLDSGLVDVALMFDSAVTGAWQVQRLWDERLLEVSDQARSHTEWDPDYIYVDLGADFRRQHAEAYPVVRTPVMTVSAAQWGLEHLLRWGGSAYLPEPVVRPYLSQKRLYPVTDTPVFQRTAWLVSRPDVDSKWAWFATVTAALHSFKRSSD